MPDKLPLVVYRDGKRVVIGEAEVNGDDISAEITDPGMIKKLNEGLLEHLSIGEDVKPKRRNVFEPDEEKD